MPQQRARLHRLWNRDAQMRSRSILCVLATAVLCLAAAPPPSNPSPTKALKLRALPRSAAWSGQQAIAADAKGRVFLLHTATLEVHPIGSGGELGEAQKLERLPDSEAPMMLLNAALSADGRRWLAQDFGSPRGLVLFENGKEKLLPATEWLPTGVGFAGDDPLFAAAAMQMGEVLGASTRQEPPFLRVLSSGGWKTIATDPIDAANPLELLAAAKDGREVIFARGAEGSFWVVQRHLYRLRRFSGAGRQLEEVRLGDARVQYSSQTKGEQERLEDFAGEAKKSGHLLPQNFGTGKKAQRVLEGAALGFDGRLYVLVSPEANEGSDRPALDRYDPTAGVLTRVDLEVADPIRRSTMAAGRDGLFLAAEPGHGGRWFISWEALDAAHWRDVPRAEVGTKINP